MQIIKSSVAASIALVSVAACADSVTIVAQRDATLIEDPAGGLANGSGTGLFVGHTGQTEDGIRRALVRFDVEGALPADSVIEDAWLTLHLSKGNSGTTPVALHRVQADWGEGASSSDGGSGAPAQPGDSTWTHSFYDSGTWVRDGGQFAGRESASADVGGTGFYSWSDKNHVASDVRLWLNDPERNFGWVLVGDEDQLRTVQKFDSRESSGQGTQPTLTIEYRTSDNPL